MSMTEYMEYTKGGDILIAPSLDYKYQYVLKCDLCNEFFGEFEQFFPHYLSHYDMESDEEDNLSQSETEDDKQLYDEIIVDEGGDGMEDEASEYVAPISECMSDNEEGVDTMTSYKEEEFDVDDDTVIIKDETTSLEEPDINYSHMEEIVHEPLELVELASNPHDGQFEDVEPVTTNALLAKEKPSVEDKSNIEYVKAFMKSKENVTALISAYRKETHLWNFSLPVENRKKEKRVATWKKIAIELKKTRNLQIKCSQVAACIIYLRQRYREKKRNDELAAKNKIEILPTWVVKQLHFLNPFVETQPIALLDIHQDMAPKQTIQILNIYKRCPHLWDTNTVEYYCTNKRKEALTEMKDIITEEMDLEVDEDSLKNYLTFVRKYYVLEKRRKMGFISGVRGKVKYNDHLTFLYDHVGPFQCSHCQRTVLSPLSLKAHESQHDGTMPFQCPQCNKEYKILDTFVFHMRRHMGDYNHECSVCGKKFLRAVEVTEHMRCHTGDRPFCCEICGSAFGHRTGFARHMKLHVKKHISFCPYCSKGFYYTHAMTMHIRTHKDERNFVCPTCGKAFKTRTTLKSHIATHENGNYECTICGKSFKNRINLWQHKRKHRLNSQIKPDSPSPFETNANNFKA